MSNPVLWAEKMATVLGEAAKRVKDSVAGSDDTAVPKVPRADAAPGGNGAPGGGGKPAGGGTGGGGGGPAGGGTGGGGPAGGGAPAGAPTGGAPQGGTSPTTGGGTDQPVVGGPSTSVPKSGGSDAKSHAEAAKKSLEEVNAIVAESKPCEAELKKFLADAQAGKKQADEAKRQVEAAQKSIPPALPVPVPQGKDPKAQYASAIQITGDMSKRVNEADAKLDAASEQAGAAEVGKASVEAALTGARKVSQKLARASEKATAAADSASSASQSAAAAAAESKSKADQAAKDKSAEKDTLQKQAQEDAQHAATAKDAAGKAQSGAKQLVASAKSAETQVQQIEKLAGEADSVAKAAKQLTTNQHTKVEPHYKAAIQAEHQEAEYKRKLSEMDAEEVLRKKYEELGGDPELTKALADEDAEFEILNETYRAELKRWQIQKTKELDEFKARLERTLKEGDATMPEARKWVEREDSPATEKIKANVQALGADKLATEPGKALTYEVEQRTARINRIKARLEFNDKLLEKTKAAMEALKERYKDIDKQYEASEGFVKDRRTELDNLLEMDRMSLEQKVDFLQLRPKPVRDRMKKQFETELSRITALVILEAKADDAAYEEPVEKLQLDPIDWKSVEQAIEKIKNAKLEDLKKDDPKLLEIREEYEKAGGDAALLAKRVEKWKQDTEASTNLDKQRAGEFKSRSEKLRAQIVEADAKLRSTEMDRDGTKGLIAYQKTRLAALDKQEKDPAAAPLSPQDKAERTLLEREIKRYETQLKHQEAEYEASKTAKANAEKLMEQERQRHEHLLDDDRNPLPKPTSDDINKMPLPAKYTELTGKSAVGGA